jgi:hypothetical protein
MADWPVTVNEYAAGSLCNSSEYKADFEKLRNAVNSLHARYSTITFNASLDDNFPCTTSGGQEYRVLHDNIDANERRVIGIMQVPSWAQAVRVRKFEVYNLTNWRGAPVGGGSATPPTLGSGEIFTIGLAWANALSDLDGSSSWDPDATIKEFAGVNGVSSGAPWTNAALAGYDGAPSPDEVPTQLVDDGLSAVVTSGNYLVIYAAGGFSLTTDGTILNGGSVNIKFHCTAWLDAMVPIP